MVFNLARTRIRLLKYFNIRVLTGLVPLIIILNIIGYLLLFSKSCVVVIRLEDIPLSLVSHVELNSTKYKVCPVYNDKANELKIPEESDVETSPNNLGIFPGGVWRPTECTARFKIAIVVCYRDRPENLKQFLAYMHRFLREQSLDYRIVVVEQAPGRPFNRAKLFNIGFQEIEKLDGSPCYIFHDVDLIPQNLNNIYACTHLVRHMSANIDIFDYKVPYDTIIGGAVAVRKSQFIDVNGFSNTFFGWGGEDDDFYNRITRDGSQICRFEPAVSQYVMLSHTKQKPSADRYYFLVTGKDRYCTDGLNSLKYSVIKLELLPLYTRILVDI